MVTQTKTTTSQNGHGNSKGGGMSKAPSKSFGGRSRWNPQPVELHAQSKVREIMRVRGITQEELGLGLGKTLQTGHDIANMNSQYTLVRVKELSDFLGVPIKEFFSDGDWEWTLNGDMAAYWRELTEEQAMMVLTVAKTFVEANRKEKLNK